MFYGGQTFVTYRAVFFDAFGTLIEQDPLSDPANTLRRRLEELGERIDLERMAATWAETEDYLRDKARQDREFALLARDRRQGFWIYAYWRLFQKLRVPEARAEYLVSQLMNRGIALEDIQADDEARPTLASLREQGLVTGMVSNAGQGLDEVCQAIGLASFLDHIIASGMAGAEKPDPQIFHFAAQQAGLPPESIIYIGDDYYKDVEGAEQAGMTGLLLDRRGEYTDVECRRVETLSGVLDFVAQSSQLQR
jgi:HAD superfamily hydrolase (TIGR01509 family)